VLPAGIESGPPDYIMRKYITLFLSLLSLNLLLTACASHKAPTIRADHYRGTIRVACVGNSITYGAEIEDRERNSYPAVLNRLLGDQFQVRNFGVSGATLLKKGDKPFWQELAFAAVSEFNPHFIILELGTSDTKSQNARYEDELDDDLGAMVEHFSKLPAKPKIWLCLPVPVYETRWGINEKALTEAVIPAILSVAEAKRLPVIDLHSALNNRPTLFPDRIHPNAQGAALIAQTIHDALVSKPK
jgi:lysophospholipase L1-like esterase